MKKLFALLTIISLLSISAFSYTSVTMHAYPNSKNYSIGNATINQEITKLKIDWITHKVEIKFHDKNSIIIEEKDEVYLNDKEKVHWLLENNGTLTIRYCESNYKFKTDRDLTLTVTLPQTTQLDDLDIESVSASIKFENLYATTAALSSTSGSIKGSFASDLDKIHCSSTSGSVHLTFENAERIVITTTSGGIHINAHNVKDSSIKSTSGSVSCNMNDGKKLYIETTSGAIKSELGAINMLSIKSTSGSKNVKIKEMETFKFNGVSGGTNITVTEKIGFGNIESTSGNITLYIPQGCPFGSDINVTTGSIRSDLNTLRQTKRSSLVVTDLNYKGANTKISSTTGSVNVYYYNPK